MHWFLPCSTRLCFNKGTDVEINPANIDWLTKKKEIIKVDYKIIKLLKKPKILKVKKLKVLTRTTKG